MKSMKVISAVGLLCTAGAASAADAPTLASVLEASGITMTGYVAASYTHFSTEFGALHQFDTNHNSFALNQAALTVGYQPAEGFGASATFIAGDDAGALNFAGNGNTNDFAIPQAFVQYKTGSFTVMAGRLLTIAGAEVIASTGNANFSRGLLFTNLEPLMHTGVRAQFAPMDTVTLTLGINNGWNVYSDNNTQKTLEAGVSYAPLKNLSFALNGYFGNESDTTANPHPGSTTLIDFLATYSPLENLTLVLNYDRKSVKDASTVGTLKTNGVALYANWAINDNWRGSVRLEQIKDDSNGGLVTGVPDEKIKSYTLTVGYLPTKSAEFDVELRKDKASDPIFDEFNSLASTDSQTEFAVQGIYKF